MVSANVYVAYRNLHSDSVYKLACIVGTIAKFLASHYQILYLNIFLSIITGLYILPDFISNGLEKIITVQMRNVSPMECSTESPARGLRISTSLNATITLTNSAFNSSEGISIILTKCLDHSTTQEFTVTVNATKDFIVWAEVIDAVLLPSCQNISGLSGMFLLSSDC